MAGVNATETGNEISQPTLEFTPLLVRVHRWCYLNPIPRAEQFHTSLSFLFPPSLPTPANEQCSD